MHTVRHKNGDCDVCNVATGAAGEEGVPQEGQRKPGFKLEAYKQRMVGVAAAMADGPLFEVGS